MLSKIKIFIFAFVTVLLFGLYSCSSDEIMTFDCNTSSLTISATGNGPASCTTDDGSITINATGGSQPYQYAIDNQAFSNSTIFSGLSAGTYRLKIKDNNGCERSMMLSLNSFSSTLSTTDKLTVSGCMTSTGIIEVNASGGSEPYMYQINGGAPQTSNQFTNLNAGNYTIKVTDQVGCSVTIESRVLSGVSYNEFILSIITTNCAVSGCHVSGGTGPGDFNIFNSVQSRASDIKSRTQSGNMPKGGPMLSQSDLDLIACWVDDGAPNN